MRLLASFLLAVGVAAPLPAQTTVTLPPGTGSLTLPPGWVALGPAELAADTRETDPQEEPGRSIVRGIAATLRRDGRAEANVLMHAPGPAPGQVRTLHAYSPPIATTSAELSTDRRIDQIRRAYEEALAGPGLQLVLLGTSKPEIFPIGSIAITFRLTMGELTLHNQIHVVPAGERLQYFEAQFFPDDLDAPAVIANVLRTFDGAREEQTDDTLQKMIMGGIVGGALGIAVALLRRGRRGRPRIGADGPSEG